MKRLIILLILALALIPIAEATGILKNNTWFYPSQSGIIFVLNKTLTGITTAYGNETCLTINTTTFCNATPNVEYLYVALIIIPPTNFYFNISDIGEDWITLSWNSSNVTAEYSLDNISWMNITIITTSWGLQSSLPAESTIYIRAKNSSTNYNYRVDNTIYGGVDEMEIAIAIVFSIFAVIFFLIGIFLYLKFKE